MSVESPRRKVSLKLLVKWTLFAVVLGFVVRYGYRQWSETDLSEVRWAPGWWIAASVLYFFSWIPAAGLWWLLLKQAGSTLPFYTAFRAHFCGHLGKYVPGKALSLVIRAAMLRGNQVSVPLAGLLATVETLLTMATGLLVALSLLPVAIGSEDALPLLELLPALEFLVRLDTKFQYAFSALILFIAVLATPLLSRGLQKLISRFFVGKFEPDPSENPGENQGASSVAKEFPIGISSKVILLGSTLVAFGWLINGCSLGCVLMGCGVSPRSFADPFLWTVAVAGATSLGFLVLFAPGGLGVREAILIALLQLSPSVGPPLAVIAAVLFRLISFLSEVIFSALLYAFPEKVSRT